ncbi:MAG: rRNA maturation RNase YbeY [Acidimicrobiia bacterium]|nr:rRNA maturation RNase YbeY [Acidimicrobiia bacterium]
MTVVCSDERPDDERTGLTIDLDRWRTLASAAMDVEGVTGELTLTFVGREEITTLNAEHMGKADPTDVLSFPLDDEPTPGVPTLLGDIVVSPAIALQQFVDHAGTLDDELALLVIHGVLHVLGHDHADPAEGAVMRDREAALLRQLHWRGDPPEAFRHDHTR